MDALMTRAQLSRMAPRAELATIAAWHGPLVQEFRESAIVTDVRQAAIMASVLNETGGLAVFDEASYINTPWSRIRQIFGGVAGVTPALVDSWRALGRQGFDEAFFNHVYADVNRGPGYRLGNTEPGDGYRFRGMGPNQLTGRGNYAWMQKETGIPLLATPELIKRPEVGAKIAAHFWRKHGLNERVDDGSQESFLWAMRKMNAGLHDFSHHLAYWAVTKAALANDALGEIPEPLPASTRKAQVMAVQRTLTARGFNTFGVDGIWGPKSSAALRGFEVANDLDDDGIVDDRVLELLGLKAKAA